MSNTDQQLIELCLVSTLKVSRRHSSVQELARIIIDALGIYDASDLASEINKVEKTMPTNEKTN